MRRAFSLNQYIPCPPDAAGFLVGHRAWGCLASDQAREGAAQAGGRRGRGAAALPALQALGKDLLPRMIPYRFINDPFKAFQERESVKPEAAKADLLLPQAGAA